MRYALVFFGLVASATAIAGDAMTVRRDSVVGCEDREVYDKLVSLAASGDQEAFAKGLSIGLAGGLCTRFENGETVYLADTALFSGLIRIRKKGDTTEYWTAMENAK